MSTGTLTENFEDQPATDAATTATSVPPLNAEADQSFEPIEPTATIEPPVIAFTDIFKDMGLSDPPQKVETPQTKAREALWEGKDPLTVISIDDVKQGMFGDCMFESTLASLANTEEGRKLISQMITVDADGSYVVRFPGDKNTPITITKEDLERSEANKGQAMWSRVLEAAYIEYVKTSPLTGWAAELGDRPYPTRAMSSGGIMRLLTGAETAVDYLTGFSLGNGNFAGIGATSIENLGLDLEEAMKNGIAVTAGIDNAVLARLVADDPTRQIDPLVPAHAYSVIGYDPATKTVTVRNPWGYMDGALNQPGSTAGGITHVGDGVLTMSLETFYGKFNSVQFSNTNPHANAAEHVLQTIQSRNDHLLAAVVGAVTGDPKAALTALTDAGIDSGYLLHEMMFLVSQGYSEEVLHKPLRTLIIAMNPAALPFADQLDKFLSSNGAQIINALAAGGDAALRAIGDAFEKLGQSIPGWWSGTKQAVGNLKDWLFGP